MLYVYRVLIVGALLGFSFIALSKVGPVNSNLDKLAACSNAPKSADQSDSRDINPANVLANLGTSIAVSKPSKSKKRRKARGQGHGGSVR